MADDAVPYELSIKIIKTFTGTNDVKLLEKMQAQIIQTHQLQNITILFKK